MLSANSIVLRRRKGSVKILFLFISVSIVSFAGAQDNSPYSRYGVGDLVPHSNIANRGMGGIISGYSSRLNINFNNPASLSALQTQVDRLGKPENGRVVFDVGVNVENRTIRSPQQINKFTSSYAGFSYIQLGIPLRKNWGMSFGLRPVSRVGYLILRKERLKDPISGDPIDSAHTEFSGDGGAYLPNISTGFRIGDLSMGASAGYLFGNRRTSTKRALVNDTVHYYSSNHTTHSSYRGLFFDLGAQYDIELSKSTTLRLGLNGNLKSEINGSQDIVRETFLRDASSGDFTVDSILNQNGVKGTVVYPSSYTAGFVIEHYREKKPGFTVGADFVQTKWSKYRFFGASDAVKDNWQFRLGGELRPVPSLRNYMSQVSYRAGLTFGQDYVNAGGDLSQWSASFGLGLPMVRSNFSPNQYSVINLSFEYNKRGNDDNLLKENIFRISAGLNLSDIWFQKRKYD
jgi:hypothetical protein